jgi:hypothetical protein
MNRPSVVKLIRLATAPPAPAPVAGGYCCAGSTMHPRAAVGGLIDPVASPLNAGTESLRTRSWREPDSNPRSHPTALAAAHIRPMFVPTPRRSSAAALADGFVPLESDRRPLPDPATSFANSHYFRPVRPKRPASTSGTRSSNPFSSSGESYKPDHSENFEATAQPWKQRGVAFRLEPALRRLGSSGPRRD